MKTILAKTREEEEMNKMGDYGWFHAYRQSCAGALESREWDDAILAIGIEK